MIPVVQKVPQLHGDCYAACIASIFEVPLEDVPARDPNQDADEHGWNEIYIPRLQRDFFYPRGLWLMPNITLPGGMRPPGYAIATCTNSLEQLHSVVTCQGEIAHDPWPTEVPRWSVPREVVCWDLICTLNPVLYDRLVNEVQRVRAFVADIEKVLS